MRTIAAACETTPDVAARVLGIHLEGPFISELDGYRGAHPAEAIRDPDWDCSRNSRNASGGRIVLVTLAPERPGAIEFIRRLTERGIVVAIGHTAADGPTIRAAVAAGRDSEHPPRQRHRVDCCRGTRTRSGSRRRCDELSASFIADGHHLDLATLRVLARCKGPDASDPGQRRQPAGRTAARHVTASGPSIPSGKIVVAGTPYLAGSNQALETGLQNLLNATDWPLREVLATVTSNPARLLGHRRAHRWNRASRRTSWSFDRPRAGAVSALQRSVRRTDGGRGR